MKMVKMLLIVTVVLTLLASSSSSSYGASYCAGGNFTSGSPYDRSLEAVAAALPRRVSSSPLLFNSSQQLAARSHSKRTMVYAIAQCQRDSRRPACARCIKEAFKDARRLCGFRAGAFIFRDDCTLSYYNIKISWFPSTAPYHKVISRWDHSDISIRGKMFEDSIRELTQATVDRTVLSSQLYATGQKAIDTMDYQLNISAAAQCLPILAADACGLCLQELIQTLSSSGEDQTGGRVASVWCSYRFALHRFFSGHPTIILPANSQGDDKTATHRRKKEITIWVSVGVVVVVGVVASIVIVLWCVKKKWLSRNNLNSGEERQEIELRDTAGEEVAHRAGSEQIIEPCPSALNCFDEIIRQADMKEIIIFLDYDGTLSPIVTDPDKAYMSDEMREVLKDVAALFKTSIVSGRARAKVFDFVRIKELNYAGSHGMDIKLASTMESTSTSEIVEDSRSYQPAQHHTAMMNRVFGTLLHATKDIKGVKIEHNIFCVSLHYRNCSEEDMPRVQKVVQNIMEELEDGVKLTNGKMVHEFRAPIIWNKGHAVRYIQGELGVEESFSIYIGDDQTDEDAFEVLRESKNGIGILVSEASRRTRAFFSLRDPSQVMEFLKMLASWKRNQQ